MKLKKIIATGIAAVMAVSSMSISAFAEDNDVVYSLMGDDGNEIIYTQADIDAGHWNVNALGKKSPFMYENFPMRINRFVNDYSELLLDLQYLKTLGANDSASCKIIDMEDENVFFETNSILEARYTEPLEINKSYMLTLTENIDGETHEYSKIIATSYEEAEMPDYVTSSVYDSDCRILVGNVEDLRLSDAIAENEDEESDVEIKRFDKVEAKNFSAYRSNLPENAIYKIYTIDENENRYTGFISTYSDMNTPSIYMPKITVCDVEDFYEPQELATVPTITASDVKNATKIDISMCRDHSFNIRKSENLFKVFKYTLSESGLDLEQDILNWDMYVSDYAAVEIWHATNENATPTKVRTEYLYNKVHISENTIDSFGCQLGSMNPENYEQEIYFVVYFPNLSSSKAGYGTISVMPKDFYPSDDVTGSAYEASLDTNAVASMEHYANYTLYDNRDVDTFFINYKDTVSKKYRASVQRSTRPVVIEVSTQEKSLAAFCPTTAPDDIKTVQANKVGAIIFTIYPTNLTFMRVYSGDQSSNDPITYSARYKVY